MKSTKKVLIDTLSFNFSVREDFKDRPSCYRHGCFTKSGQLQNKADSNAALQNDIISKNLCF